MLSVMNAALFLAALLSFGEGRAVLHPTAAPPYALIDTVIRVRLDVKTAVVYGNETVSLRMRKARATLPFDSVDIHYRSVTVNGRKVRFSVDDAAQRVTIRLTRQAAAGTPLTVRFSYWARPKRGLYFVRPDHHYPDINPEVWTQGEPEDNRRWFPTWDEPNVKTASELVITVPHGWTAIANGHLAHHAAGATDDTWDWVSPHRKSTYLIAFAAGPFSEYRSSLGVLHVDSFVAPADAKFNETCFRDTPKMIDYYQRLIGFPYPFAKYDQIGVERFTAGGMEDSSATIVSDSFLHPANEDVERNCDNVVSHELAQQWFGDDVTMSDWSNEWINEGFATYFDELWSGHQYGEPGFEYARYQGQTAFFDEAKRYLRPIVDYRYNDPLDLFDISGHERAAAALHMLRYLVGDKRFFAALHEYLAEYRYRNADTNQFFASLERFLHEDLSWFKDEWFYRASYPHYIVSDRYDARAKTLLLTVRQQNPDGRPFRMPVVIEAYASNRTARARVWIDRNLQTVRLANVDSAPLMVLFDPNENLLRDLTFAQPVSMLTYQATRAPHVGDREWALSQLAGLQNGSTPERSAALNTIRWMALHDAFDGVREDAVDVSARFGDTATVLASLDDPDTNVRIEAERAAAGLPESNSHINRQLERLTLDPNPDIVAAALETLGARRAPGAYVALTSAVARASYHDVIAAGALRGLGALGDPRALPLLVKETAYGISDRKRNAAVGALASLAKRTKNVAAALPLLLRLVSGDPLISTRLAAAGALAQLGDARAIATLERVEENDSQEIVRIEAWRVVQQLRQ